MRRDIFTLMENPASLPRKAAGSTDQHGRVSAMATTRKVGGSRPTTPPDRPRVSHLINDNMTDQKGEETVDLCQTSDVINIPVATPDLPVGARLHQIWETLTALGASPKVKKITRKGYTLPDQTNLDKVTDHHKWLCTSS